MENIRQLPAHIIQSALYKSFDSFLLQVYLKVK